MRREKGRSFSGEDSEDLAVFLMCDFTRATLMYSPVCLLISVAAMNIHTSSFPPPLFFFVDFI